MTKDLTSRVHTLELKDVAKTKDIEQIKSEMIDLKELNKSQVKFIGDFTKAQTETNKIFDGFMTDVKVSIRNIVAIVSVVVGSIVIGLQFYSAFA